MGIQDGQIGRVEHLADIGRVCNQRVSARVSKEKFSIVWIAFSWATTVTAQEAAERAKSGIFSINSRKKIKKRLGAR